MLLSPGNFGLTQTIILFVLFLANGRNNVPCQFLAISYIFIYSQCNCIFVCLVSDKAHHLVGQLRFVRLVQVRKLYRVFEGLLTNQIRYHWDESQKWMGHVYFFHFY